MNILFLKPAEAELDDAIEYYESEQVGLGIRFRNEVLRSLGRIAKHPVAYQALSKQTRRCLIAKFPYGIIYQHKAATDEILIIAIAHLHRKPDYWLSRNS